MTTRSLLRFIQLEASVFQRFDMAMTTHPPCGLMHQSVCCVFRCLFPVYLLTFVTVSSELAKMDDQPATFTGSQGYTVMVFLFTKVSESEMARLSF